MGRSMVQPARWCTRSTRAASPTTTVTGSATCPASSTACRTWPGWAWTRSGCPRSTRRRSTTAATTSATTSTWTPGWARSATSTNSSRSPEATGSGSSSIWRRITARPTTRCSRRHWRRRRAAPSGHCSSSVTAGDRRRRAAEHWPSRFGGRAWTRVPDGQWYLHLFDSSQPDWNWRDPRVGAMFEEILRFWLDRGIGGFRVDVAHGLFKDPQLADVADVTLTNRPSAYYHRPEVHAVYRRWREILDSYPSDGFPGARTAVGEVWADSAATLRPTSPTTSCPRCSTSTSFRRRGRRRAARGDRVPPTRSRTDRAPPWVIGNHDVVRPVTRWRRRARPAPPPYCCWRCPARPTSTRARSSACRRSRTCPRRPTRSDLPAAPAGKEVGRDGCRVPLPWSAAGASFGFSRTDPGSDPAPPWLPQPPGWGALSVAVQSGDPGSFLSLYQAALRLRRQHPALGSGPGGGDAMRWLDAQAGALVFRRDPGFLFAVNLGASAGPLPPHSRGTTRQRPARRRRCGRGHAAPRYSGLAGRLTAGLQERAIVCDQIGLRRGGMVGQIRVPRKGVTQAELASVLSRRLGGGFEVAADDGTVIVRRSPLSAAVVRIGNAPGATVFRVRGPGCRSLAWGRRGRSPTHCAGHRSSVASDATFPRFSCELASPRLPLIPYRCGAGHTIAVFSVAKPENRVRP